MRYRRCKCKKNPHIPDIVQRCTYGFPVAGQNVRITAADLYPLASPADQARIERPCRNGSSYSGEYGDVLSGIWARLGWPMPTKTNPKRKNPATFDQKRALFNKQLSAFKRNYHIPARRKAIALALQRFLDKDPWFVQTLPFDLLGIIRSAAREAGHTKSLSVRVGDRVQFFAPGEMLKSGRVIGISGGERVVQVGDYAYSVKPHDIRQVY